MYQPSSVFQKQLNVDAYHTQLANLSRYDAHVTVALPRQSAEDVENMDLSIAEVQHLLLSD